MSIEAVFSKSFEFWKTLESLDGDPDFKIAEQQVCN